MRCVWLLEVTSEYRMDGAFLPSVMLALLSASTLVGVGVGSLSVFLTSLEVTPYVFIGVFSFFFLLVTVLLLLGMQRDKRLVASYPVVHAKIDSVIAVSRKFGMTRREEEILRLLMEEKTSLEIADCLCLSRDTVKGHIKNIYKKAGVHSRQELLAYLSEDWRTD